MSRRSHATRPGLRTTRSRPPTGVATAGRALGSRTFDPAAKLSQSLAHTSKTRRGVSAFLGSHPSCARRYARPRAVQCDRSIHNRPSALCRITCHSCMLVFPVHHVAVLRRGNNPVRVLKSSSVLRDMPWNSSSTARRWTTSRLDRIRLRRGLSSCPSLRRRPSDGMRGRRARSPPLQHTRPRAFREATCTTCGTTRRAARVSPDCSGSPAAPRQQPRLLTVPRGSFHEHARTGRCIGR